MEETDSFDLPVQKRLWVIEKNWEKFKASILLKAPGTNNSLKTTTSPSLKHTEKNRNGQRNTGPHEGLKNFVFRPRKSKIFEGFKQ